MVNARTTSILQYDCEYFYQVRRFYMRPSKCSEAPASPSTSQLLALSTQAAQWNTIVYCRRRRRRSCKMRTSGIKQKTTSSSRSSSSRWYAAHGNVASLRLLTFVGSALSEREQQSEKILPSGNAGWQCGRACSPEQSSDCDCGWDCGSVCFLDFWYSYSESLSALLLLLSIFCFCFVIAVVGSVFFELFCILSVVWLEF